MKEQASRVEVSALRLHSARLQKIVEDLFKYPRRHQLKKHRKKHGLRNRGDDIGSIYHAKRNCVGNSSRSGPERP